MRAVARLRFYRSSAQKVRLVADTVRGQGVPKALSVLRLTNKRCSKDLERLLQSAVANLEQKAPGVDSGRLFVERIVVDQAPSLKRHRAASLGRIHPRLHRYCHVTVQVAEREK